MLAGAETHGMSWPLVETPKDSMHTGLLQPRGALTPPTPQLHVGSLTGKAPPHFFPPTPHRDLVGGLEDSCPAGLAGDWP